MLVEAVPPVRPPDHAEVRLGGQRLLGVVLDVDVDSAPARLTGVDQEALAAVGEGVALAAVEASERNLLLSLAAGR